MSLDSKLGEYFFAVSEKRQVERTRSRLLAKPSTLKKNGLVKSEPSVAMIKPAAGWSRDILGS